MADRVGKYTANTRAKIDFLTPPSIKNIRKNIQRIITNANKINHQQEESTDSLDWYNQVREVTSPPNPNWPRAHQTAIHRFRLGYRRWADIPTYPAYAPCECQHNLFNIPHALSACPTLDRTPLLPITPNNNNLSENELALEILKNSSKNCYKEIIEFYSINRDKLH